MSSNHEELAAVERARQIHFSAFEIAESHMAHRRLDPKQMLDMAHNLLDVIIPAHEIQPLDLAYFALLRRINDPTVLANLDELLEDDYLIERVRDGLDLATSIHLGERLDAWTAAERIARHPIDVEELEAVKQEYDEHIRRFMAGTPPAQP